MQTASLGCSCRGLSRQIRVRLSLRPSLARLPLQSGEMKPLGAIVFLVAVIFGWSYLHRPLTYPPGVLLPDDPLQTATSAGPDRHGDVQLTPLADFQIDARVLHRKVYHDNQADLVPVDLALGWGAMSDQSVLDRISISQSMRCYFYEYKLPPPIPKEEIIAHSTNLHVIPATSEIASRCESLRTGELVHLSGELVEAKRPDGATWRSSLSRTDTGNGACELMLVNEVTVLPTPNPVYSIVVSRN